MVCKFGTLKIGLAVQMIECLQDKLHVQKSDFCATHQATLSISVSRRNVQSLDWLSMGLTSLHLTLKIVYLSSNCNFYFIVFHFVHKCTFHDNITHETKDNVLT